MILEILVELAKVAACDLTFDDDDDGDDDDDDDDGFHVRTRGVSD